MQGKVRIEKFRDLEQLSRAAAKRISAELSEAVRLRGLAGLVLAGGRTPATTYGLLAADPTIAWERVHLFWGDERWLPPEDPQSNFAMVNESLLSKITIPEPNIHAIDYAAESPETAATLYDRNIRDFFLTGHSSGDGACFDLTILGMGEDGHTASLFPGHPLLKENSSYAAAVKVPSGKPKVPRITMTLPALARSRKILFLISGDKKERILNEILQGRNHDSYPAAAVHAMEEECWYVAAGI